MPFNDPYGGYYGYAPQNYQPKANNQPIGGSFVWVNSRKEAEEYPLGANGAQMLMNRNEKVFYLKACDGFGMVSSFKVFPYYEETQSSEAEANASANPPSSAEFVSREEFEKLRSEFEKLKARSTERKEDIDE